MPRRITARLLEQAVDPLRFTDLSGRTHLYFHQQDHAENEYHRKRCLFVFTCPAEGPTTPEHWRMLRRVVQGHGIARYGVVYLFTDVDLLLCDLRRGEGSAGPLADSSLTAALRWTEDAWRPRGGNGAPGKVVLCYGQPFGAKTVGAAMLREREAVLWAGLRTFKRRVSAAGRTRTCAGHNPLTITGDWMAEPGFVDTAPDGGPLPDTGCVGWWVPRPS